MMSRPSLRSILEGGAVAVIGASILLLVPSQIQPVAALQTRMSPGLIPGVAAVGLILSGLGLILQSSLKGGAAVPVEMDRQVTIRIVTSVLLLIAYTLLFPRVGFVVTSAVFVAFFSWYFGARDPIKITLVTVGTPIVVWLFFEKLFLIPVPHGFLF